MQRRTWIAGAASLPAMSALTAMTTMATLTTALTPARAQTATAPRWWFIFLESGKPVPDDKAAVEAMQRGHLDNFKKLVGEGKLFAAGPMRDPSRQKRGIVVVQAPDRETLLSYFQPDEYVREGYMVVNAQPATVHQALHHTGIDPNGIEENRIVLFTRAEAQDKAAVPVFLKRALDEGAIGAWYSLEDGPIGEVAFMRGTDETALRRTMAEYPGLSDQRVTMKIWPQWLGKGVLR